ncbi:MAG: T9SS type A sorting domain-containing protein [bacterium]|nr:T9SS type A sorting domain-containing protein [bacterium]
MKKVVFGLVALCLPFMLFAGEMTSFSNKDTTWQKIVTGVLDGDTMAVYLGGDERHKPTFADLDNDNDLDMFVGDWDGTIRYFENIGTATSPKFSFVTDFFDSIYVRLPDPANANIRGYSKPTFIDLDNDNDLDLVCGDFIGKTHFYKNVGTVSSPHFDFIDTLHYGWLRHPCNSLADIDNDGDLDMAIGEENGGKLHFFENVYGAADTSIWTHIGDSTVFKHITETYVPDSGMTQVDPAFIDIDDDSDFDLFIGNINGHLLFWKNIGTVDSAIWTFVSSFYDSITSLDRSGPGFTDIDGDGDFDLFMGSRDGLMRFYQNVGTADSADFTLVTDLFNYLDFGGFTTPAFADIDEDGKIDMYIGNGFTSDGKIRKLKNIGLDNWEYETKNYGDTINAGAYSAPAFVDINADSKLDLFIGNTDGVIYLYANTGTGASPVWVLTTANFSSIDVGKYSKPTFWDIDADNDMDLFIGNDSGKIYFYRNDGTPTIPTFTFITDNYLDTLLPGHAAPTFGDLDPFDGHTDLLVGVGYGTGVDSATGGCIYHYRNIGDSAVANWTLVSTKYNGIDVGRNATPALVDIDKDGDMDLFVGEGDGGINLWRNKIIGIEENSPIATSNAKLDIIRNPSFRTAKISYSLPAKSNVSLKIYDLSGRCVKTLFSDQEQSTGSYQVNISQGTIPTGTYFARLSTGSGNIVKKFILMK